MLQNLRRVYSSRELIWNLTQRELKTKYRNSVLGWAWSLLNPLSTVLIYSLVFGIIFEATAPIGEPSGLDSFPLFLLVGVLVWGHFALVALLGLNAVSGNSGLVRRVSFPREALVISNSLHGLVQFMIEISLMVVIVLLFGGSPLRWLPTTVVLVVLLNIFSTGFGLALGAMSVYFKDLSHLWAVVIQAWFFLTPIVYPPEYIEGRAPFVIERLIDLNPMSVFVGAFRQTIYSGGNISLNSLGWLISYALISLIGGWAIFSRLGRRFAEEV